jgi:hypothetical protein
VCMHVTCEGGRDGGSGMERVVSVEIVFLEQVRALI